MAVRPIAKLGEPVLRQVAAKVEERSFGSGELGSLVTDLIDTMRAATGAGLAAPQIGVPLAVCVMEVKANSRYPSFPELPLTVLVNPVVTALSSDALQGSRIAIYEGCLSVPGLRGRVIRPARVQLSARSPEGEPIERTVEGVEAAILQHEVDHLFATVFVDRAEPKTLTFMDEYARYVPERERVVWLD